MEEKIIIGTLAEMARDEFGRLEERMVVKELFKEGFEVLLSEIRGLWGDFFNMSLRGSAKQSYNKFIYK